MKAAFLIAFFLFALFCGFVYAYYKGYINFPGSAEKPVAEARPIGEGGPYRNPMPDQTESESEPVSEDGSFIPLDSIVSNETGIEVIPDPEAPLVTEVPTGEPTPPIDPEQVEVPTEISITEDQEVATFDDLNEILAWEERPDLDSSSIPTISVATPVIFDDMQIQVDIPTATVVADSPVVIGSGEPLLEEANSPVMEITNDELEQLRRSLRAAQAQAESEV